MSYQMTFILVSISVCPFYIHTCIMKSLHWQLRYNQLTDWHGFLLCLQPFNIKHITNIDHYTIANLMQLKYKHLFNAFNVIIINKLKKTNVRKLFLLPNDTKNNIKTFNDIKHQRDTAIHFVTDHYLLHYM